MITISVLQRAAAIAIGAAGTSPAKGREDAEDRTLDKPHHTEGRSGSQFCIQITHLPASTGEERLLK